jgi:hypothetical protein
VFDKLKFWKKNDDFADLDLGFKEDNLGLNIPSEKGDMSSKSGSDFSMGSDNFQSQDMFSAPSNPQFSKQQQPQYMGQNQFSQKQQYQQPQPEYTVVPPSSNQTDQIIKKDLEIINIKLDSLKSSMDALGQRLSSIERSLNERRW